ncbi:hypothetical protein [Candidatus Poriferisocius sp.]|uniref:hypothetical protein n=1 Tax=Candidatus Poriferisocius sp. TaxID=3101276 RepID=UPI003B026BF4
MSRPLDVLGTPGWGEVDACGSVRPGTGDWTLDWWVGASDRWHRASQEATVGQSDVGVVETRMKLPDGDAVQRVWAVAGGGTAVAVVEVGNEAATAFAVALIVEVPGKVVKVDRTGLVVGDQPVLVWDRPPAAAATGPGAIEAVLHPGTGAVTGDRGLSGGGRDIAALVWPLPHTARLAVSTALGRGPLLRPSDLPEADAVVRGWRSHLDRGALIEVPDGALAGRIDRNRHRWLGSTGRMETVGMAELCRLSVRLDHHGYHQDAEVVLNEIAERWTTEAPTERLTAFGVHHDLTRSRAAAVRYVEAVAEAVEAAARVGAEVPVESIVRLLNAAGQSRAARDLEGLDLRPAEAIFPRSRVREYRGDLEGLDLRPAEPREEGLRAELVSEQGDHLLLVPGFRPAWRGGPLAVYGLPTRFGPVSYAVRWHGDRPALLWELAAHPDQEPITVRAPALDESWFSEQVAGEALLVQ